MGPRFDPAPPGWITPVTLEGDLVRLEPLARGHVPGLAQIGLDPAIHQWTRLRPRDEADLRSWVDAALAAAATGTEVPFEIVTRASGAPMGSTRYMAIAPEHRRLEIGWTWLGVNHQRTGANREAKRLLLAHAFESLGANRVEFKTDSRNERSRSALLGIGATFDGIFRNHMITPTGIRHSAWYSVTIEDWPAVRARLEWPRDRQGAAEHHPVLPSSARQPGTAGHRHQEELP